MDRGYLKREMKKLIESYEYQDGDYYDTSDYGLTTIIDEWEEQKADLLDAFEKHPNYNGNGQIVLSERFHRELDEKEAKKQLDWFKAEAAVEFNTGLHELLCFIQGTKLKENKIDANMVEYAKSCLGDDPKLRLHEGQKLSKGLRKIMTECGLNEVEDFEKHYAKLADALSPLSIERPFVLSVNPLDYLTMSFGDNWTSCHTIDKTNIRKCGGNGYQGCYSSGTLSYMLDETSIVMYTLSREADLEYPERNDKVQRQMCHYDNAAKKIIFGRLYPADTEDTVIYKQFREIAQRVLSEAFDIPNLWNTSKGRSACAENTSSSGTHYRDYTCYDVGALSVHQIWADCNRSVHIGHDPICPSCGCTHRLEEIILCDDCANIYVCDRCGEPIHGDYIYTEDGRYYCDSECAHADGYYEADDTNYCWYHEDDLVYDTNYNQYYYHESVVVDCDEGTFISEESAREYGLECDTWSGDWFTTDNDTIYIGDCVYEDDYNAEADGNKQDAWTGEWFYPNVNSVHDEETDLWYMNINNAYRNGYGEEVAA